MNTPSKADMRLSEYYNNERHTKKFVNYSPDSLYKLLGYLGSPHLYAPVFHVAGTNGKGSTASYIHALLMADGVKTGLFTSPHLVHIHERIMINSEIEDDVLVELVDEIELVAEKHDLVVTWFDMLSAVAFVFFHQMKAEAMVIECGLGGRLDSTNCVSPEVSIITEISFDHCHILGSTIEEIAFEKAGIIKAGRPVVSSTMDSRARDVLKQRAKELKSKILFYGDDYSFDDYYQRNSAYEIVQPGDFQKINFASAVTAVNESGFSLKPDSLRVAANLHIRGRCETIFSKPLVIFDPAHNVSAIRLLLEYAESRYHMPIKVFVSVMEDKDYQKMIDIIRSGNHEIVYILQDDPRQYKATETAVRIIHEQQTDEIVAALGIDSVNLFTGTFRLYSTVRNLPIVK